ncbi:MAG: hypothetical protein KBD78_11995 [Oligoflexales bacterium]|nr:hypothetical protein [Oligoflexales bacterium]
MRIILYFTFFLSFSDLAVCQVEGVNEMEQEARRAYVDIFRSAKKFDTLSKKAQVRETEKKLNDINRDRFALKSRYSESKLAKILTSIESYEEVLSKADQENWALSAYNLALARLEAAIIVDKEIDRSVNAEQLKKSADLLNDPRVQSISFPLYSEAQFLLYRIYDFLDDSALSRKTLEKMAQFPTESVYSFYGFEKLGDLYFNEEKDELAVSAYKTALPGYSSKAMYKDVFSLKYKLAWAAYRSNNSPNIEKHCIDFLNDPLLRSEENYQSMADEISHIYSSYLYFDNDNEQLKIKLEEHKNTVFYASLVRNVVYFTLQSGQVGEADFLVRSVIDKLIVLREYPDILLLMMAAFKDSPHQGIFYSDRLAELASKNSAWSMLYATEDDGASLKIPIRAALIISATYYYKKAVATRNLSFYSKSRDFFDILVELDKSNNIASQWAIYVGHTYLNSNNFREAIISYETTLKNLRLSEEEIIDVKYRLVLALQGAIYADYGDRDLSDVEKESLNEDLNILEKYSIEISTQFPKNLLAHEVLATSSAVLRDFERFDVAHGFWKKLLLLTHSTALRERAIRGLVYNAISNLSPKSALEQTKLILRSENWNKVSPELYNEIIKIAETSVINEVERLKSSAEFKLAAHEYTALIEEFPEIFNKEYFYRDAAYCFAMGEEWGSVKKIAQDFLREFQISEFRADVLYIIGKAFQETFDYSKAAESYLELASRHPKHRRSEESLKFAIAYYQKSGESTKTAEAIKIMGNFVKSGAGRFQASLDAIHSLVKNNQYVEALNIANALLDKDLTRSQKVQAKFIKIKLLFLTERKNEADVLTKRFQRDFAVLGPKLSEKIYETTKVDLEILLIDGDLSKFKALNVTDDLKGYSTLEERVRIYRKVNSRLSPLLSLKRHSAHRQIHLILYTMLEGLIFDHDQLLLSANTDLVFSERAFLDKQMLMLRAEHMAQQGALRLSNSNNKETENLRSYISNTFKVYNEY